MSIVELDRRAVLASLEVVGAIPADRWGSVTPCSAWDLGALVAHMTAQHRGFAAAAGGSRDPSVWAVHPLGPAPRDDYAASARAVLDALAQDGVVDRDFSLPEITVDRMFPGAQAIGFHFVDYVLHTWDVAAAIGLRPSFDDDVVDEALRVVERDVPVGPAREQPGASFAPPVSSTSDATAFDRLLTLTGRSPLWAAPPT